MPRLSHVGGSGAKFHAVVLTTGHRAKVEEKPEVRNAGGVFYTPTFIVNFMVRRTLGEALKECTVNWIGTRNKTRVDRPRLSKPLHVLDPACGSGSFLLEAYQYLLDWHLDFYCANDPSGWATRKNPPVYLHVSRRQTSDGILPRTKAHRSQHWKLSIDERKRILLDHIFGVDIDSQAVEVTKLSLLLKVLEDETAKSLQQHFAFFSERALPDLGNNIRCGNSLFDVDYYSCELLPASKIDESRIKPFRWTDEFANVFASGGFEVVLGNPPYVDIKGLPPSDVDYLFKHFRTANSRINLFSCFVEKALGICSKDRFLFSMIVPTALLSQSSYEALRKVVLDTGHIDAVVRLPNETFGKAAGDVKVDTMIFVVSSPRPEGTPTEIISYSGYERIKKIDPATATLASVADQETWRRNPENIWTIAASDVEQDVVTKCEHNSTTLEDCAEFCLGLTPYDKYKGHTPEQISGQVFHADHKRSSTFRPLLAGNDVTRYLVEWNGSRWINYGPWLGAARERRFFTSPRILVKQIIDWSDRRIWAAATDEELYNTQNAFNLIPKKDWNIYFLLGVINSKLMTFYHKKRYLDEHKMRFQKILIKDAKRFPIHGNTRPHVREADLRKNISALL
jgi:hypothetical protein